MSSQLAWLATTKVPLVAGVPSQRTSAPQIAAAPRMKRRGQRERPRILLSKWGRMQKKNQRPRPAIRANARRRDDCGSATPVDSDAIQLHAMVDEAETELLGDALLEHFKLLI